jgi:hypothetical protein
MTTNQRTLMTTRNPYFAQRPRACITQGLEISTTLLKLCMRSCLRGRGRLTYRGKIEVYHFDECIQIARPAEPTDVIEIDPNRVEDAVNLFVDSLVAEVSFNPDDFIFYPQTVGGDGISWGRLRRLHAFRTLIDPNDVPFRSLVQPPNSPDDFDLLHTEPDQGDPA